MVKIILGYVENLAGEARLKVEEERKNSVARDIPINIRLEELRNDLFKRSSISLSHWQRLTNQRKERGDSDTFEYLVEFRIPDSDLSHTNHTARIWRYVFLKAILL